ncbi:hypothetical protein GCM10009838_88320 [Catenulispora subtropica]|uniref:Uncharacterized protein n=1 Tax=Catenulispora subtropica TaxID=450798 RepID=A0ABP5EUK6_9ACTN
MSSWFTSVLPSLSAKVRAAARTCQAILAKARSAVYSRSGARPESGLSDGRVPRSPLRPGRAGKPRAGMAISGVQADAYSLRPLPVTVGAKVIAGVNIVVNWRTFHE